MQGMQLPAAAAAAKCPATHNLHSDRPCSSAKCPLVQFAHDALPLAAAILPTVHFVHARLASASANWPSAHAAHGCDTDVKLRPGAHFLQAAVPVSFAKLPAAQLLHATAPGFPFVLRPTSQATHDPENTASENLPAGQRVQSYSQRVSVGVEIARAALPVGQNDPAKHVQLISVKTGCVADDVGKAHENCWLAPAKSTRDLKV